MKTVQVKVSIAIVVAGKVVPPGAVIELDERTAKEGFRDGSLIPVPLEDAKPVKFRTGKLDRSNFDGMTRAELVKTADDLGIAVPSNATKAQIIDLICAEEVEIEEPVK